MRHSSRTTYMAAAIIIFCILYWVSVTGPEPMLTSHDFSHFSYKGSAGASADVASESDKKSKSKGDADKSSSKAPKADTGVPFDAKFPRQIWQTANEEGKTKYADKSLTWSTLKGFEYNFLNDEDATKYVHQHFKSNPSIVRFWDSLSAAVLKADFLRYLIMLSSGGVYSDIDTTCLAHPDTWIPTQYGAREINAIIGIEYDDTKYKMFVRPISFCQWTLMAKPNHPIFQHAVQRVMSNLEFLARKQKVELAQLTLDKLDVLEATGPGMITDVVMQVLRDQKQWVDWATFHEQKEPRIYGDVLILPINGFAASQKHSHAGDPAYGDKLVAHHFGRTWYKRPDGSDKLVMSPEAEQKDQEKEKVNQELKDVMNAVKDNDVAPFSEPPQDDGKLRVPIPAAALQKTVPGNEKDEPKAGSSDWVEFPDGGTSSDAKKSKDTDAATDDSKPASGKSTAPKEDSANGTVGDKDVDPTADRKTTNPDPITAADLDGESASMKTKAKLEKPLADGDDDDDDSVKKEAKAPVTAADVAKESIQKTSVSMSGKAPDDDADKEKKEKEEVAADPDEFTPKDLAALVKAADAATAKAADKISIAKGESRGWGEGAEAKEKMAGMRVDSS